MTTPKDFVRLDLGFKENPFDALLEASPVMEKVTKGRWGGLVVSNSSSPLVPLVRTTTRYSSPPRHFQPIHQELIDSLGKGFSFNNCMVELYDDDYRTMGFHSDQAQDLVDDSYIAVVSFYRDPEGGGGRHLVVKDKDSGEERVLPMDHGTALIFSTETNRRFYHKIVLGEEAKGNQWYGLTFRQAQSFMDLSDPKKPLLLSRTPIHLADEEERRAFYKLRSQENKNKDFCWPPIDYSISPSDFLLPLP